MSYVHGTTLRFLETRQRDPIDLGSNHPKDWNSRFYLPVLTARQKMEIVPSVAFSIIS
jgi:hypothetical protein